MKPTKIALFGCGGHAKVVADIVNRNKELKLVAMIGLEKEVGQRFLGIRIVSLDQLPETGATLGCVCLGENWQRKQLVESVLDRYPQFCFTALVHSSAQIAEGVSVGEGTVISAGAIVNSGTHIGKHCIVNTNASVDHDCQLGEFSSVGPGATLGGNVTVGTGSAIAQGACVIHGISVGDHTVVGAGSVVVRSIPSNVKAFGNPCKVQAKRQENESYLTSDCHA